MMRAASGGSIGLSPAQPFLEGEDEVVVYRPPPMHMDLSMALAAGSREELDSMVAAQAAVQRASRSTGVRYTRRRRRLSTAGSRISSMRGVSRSPTTSARSNSGSRRGSLNFDGPQMLRASGRTLSVNRGNVGDLGSTLRKAASSDDFAAAKKALGVNKPKKSKGASKKGGKAVGGAAVAKKKKKKKKAVLASKAE